MFPNSAVKQMRKELGSALKRAMKERDKLRLSTLRLILAAIKDREIAARSEGLPASMSDDEIRMILATMVRQRLDRAAAYEKAGRIKHAERERSEIAVINEFLPKPLTDEECVQAVREAIGAMGASGIRDMGRVMGHLRTNYAGRIDLRLASSLVRERLARPGR